MTSSNSPLFIIPLLLIATFVSCQSQPPVDDIVTHPQKTDGDTKFADVYRPLDGTWRGIFYIYEDSTGQQAGESQPTHLPNYHREKMPLRLLQQIEVEQVYVSESPFFQEVQITDTYNDGKDNIRQVNSTGVNKVQNGEMLCVVIKPDETVIHRGELEGKNTIIWYRKQMDPLKIERFHETVLQDSYTVWGWGYYGTDDPALTPRLWFYGDYKRLRKASGF